MKARTEGTMKKYLRITDSLIKNCQKIILKIIIKDLGVDFVINDWKIKKLQFNHVVNYL